jgi:hypothetical protein
LLVAFAAASIPTEEMHVVPTPIVQVAPELVFIGLSTHFAGSSPMPSPNSFSTAEQLPAKVPLVTHVAVSRQMSADTIASTLPRERRLYLAHALVSKKGVP